MLARLKFIAPVALLAMLLLGVVVYQIFKATKSPPVKVDKTTDPAEIALKKLPENASNQQKKARLDAAYVISRPSDVLILTKDCRPQPQVIRLPNHSRIAIQNRDNAPHSIEIFKGKLINLKPSEIKSISLDFNSSGLYGYNCDSQNDKSAGLIFVTEN